MKEKAPGFACYVCGSPTKVIDSRVGPERSYRRRRICRLGHRFTTSERVVHLTINSAAIPNWQRFAREFAKKGRAI